MTPPTDAQRKHFAEQGEYTVRSLVQTAGYPLRVQQAAIQWLAELDREAKEDKDRSHAEMASTASRAATAAERAATAAEAQARTAKQALITAIVATVIAATALIVSILAALHITQWF